MSMMSNDYAVYLPAVNANYARTIVADLPPDRSLPSGLSLEDFAFWQSDSSLWNHPYCLHSIGQYSVGSNTSNAMTHRSSAEGLLFGDSGGYQLGGGKLKGVDGLVPNMSAEDACAVWRSRNEVKAWIVNWLEAYTNYAMTIDVPLWTTLPKYDGTPFHKCSIEQITGLTVENLRFIDEHRRGGTKWLNVIQGLDALGMLNWWDTVKWFDCSGYAFSVEAAKSHGLRAILEPLLTLRDEGAFSSGRDWLHMLGSSETRWAVLYTAIQMGLRETNPAMRISFDSSSPFQKAGRYQDYCQVPAFGSDGKGWSFKWEHVPRSHIYHGSDRPLPFSSPIADKLTLGDLNINPDQYSVKYFDSLSDLYVMNHNAWVYLSAFQQCNDLVFSGRNEGVPSRLKSCVDAVIEAFKVGNWRSFLESEKGLFDGFRL